MSQPAARILVVEDTPTQAELATAFLNGLGHEVRVAVTAGSALEQVRDWQPDAMLLDLQLPDFSGFELMRQLRAEAIECAVVVATANGSVNTAVEAMREGAADFLVKPFARARLVTTIANVLEKRALAAELKSVRAKLDRGSFVGFIGGSPPMQGVYRTIESVAASKASVFIVGESGTGKELAAEAVHRSSPRRGKAFVPINCGAIPRDLLESEIFGHVRGAFTGATADRVGAAKLADGGTLFLDEIGEMPLEMQVKLLRFIQTGTLQPVGSSRLERVDVRFVCATNRDPMAEVEAGRFREDLFYRLYVVPVDLPPLRARGDDVLLIARHFLSQFSREEGRRFTGFSPEAEQALLAYSWPGNVRQLQNVVRNIVVLHDAEAVTPAMLPGLVLRGSRPTMARIAPESAPQPASGPAPQPELASAGPAAEQARPLAGLEMVTAIVPAAAIAQAQLQAQAQAPAQDEAGEPPRAVPVADAFAAVPDMLAPLPRPAPAPMPAEADAVRARPAEPVFAQAFTQAAAPLDIVPLSVMERKMIMAALQRTGNDVPRAAAMLEVNPSTIYRKLQAWRTESAQTASA